MAKRPFTPGPAKGRPPSFPQNGWGAGKSRDDAQDEEDFFEGVRELGNRASRRALNPLEKAAGRGDKSAAARACLARLHGGSESDIKRAESNENLADSLGMELHHHWLNPFAIGDANPVSLLSLGQGRLERLADAAARQPACADPAQEAANAVEAAWALHDAIGQWRESEDAVGRLALTLARNKRWEAVAAIAESRRANRSPLPARAPREFSKAAGPQVRGARDPLVIHGVVGSGMSSTFAKTMASMHSMFLAEEEPQTTLGRLLGIELGQAIGTILGSPQERLSAPGWLACSRAAEALIREVGWKAKPEDLWRETRRLMPPNPMSMREPDAAARRREAMALDTLKLWASMASEPALKKGAKKTKDLDESLLAKACEAAFPSVARWAIEMGEDPDATDSRARRVGVERTAMHEAISSLMNGREGALACMRALFDLGWTPRASVSAGKGEWGLEALGSASGKPLASNRPFHGEGLRGLYEEARARHEAKLIAEALESAAERRAAQELASADATAAPRSAAKEKAQSRATRRV
jgi:hypothetical protein